MGLARTQWARATVGSHESGRAPAAFSSRLGRTSAPAVSVAGAISVLASYRGGSTYAPPYETFVIVPLIVAMALAAVLIALYVRRRQRRPKPVADQWQAMAVMGELCPHGWQAQITLYGWGAPVPPDAPSSRVPLVELEWKQFEEEPGRVAIARRAWAPTIAEALQMMVEDRRTDLALEQIEQAAAEDGETWWND
jgi:hypothetical protein